MSSGAFGIINILKSPGPTSHDIVARLRRLLGERKIGHGGTLDPGASGVLPILVGKATKLMPFVLEHVKEYRAEMTLGIATDTHDASGETLRVDTGFSLRPTALADVLYTFVGEIEQVPPMASAVRKGGKRLYELARMGETVEREPRTVRIEEIHVRAVRPSDAQALLAGTRVLLDVRCSRGTYIRTLCHDIGERLGCGAHMSFLVRTAVGTLRLADAFTIEEIEEAVKQGGWRDMLIPPERVLEHLARVRVDRRSAERLRQGQSIPAPKGDVEEALVHVVEERGGLVCIGRIETDRGQYVVKPVRVL